MRGWRGAVGGATIALFVAVVACSTGGEPVGGPAHGEAGPLLKAARVTHSPPVSDPKCLQAAVDRSHAPRRASYVYPLDEPTPFYQWESNNGYCGEVSLIQAGLQRGQWMSQLDARLVCGAAGNGHDAPLGVPLSQSGPDRFCAAHQGTPDYNAQLLLEDAAAANAARCLSNARLAYRTFDGGPNDAGPSGYRAFMAWIKAETIAGHNVALGVFVRFAGDAQYDHIVTVLAVGTDHDTDDSSYYDDDVLYFDDHGAITAPLLDYPVTPPGTGKTAGCAPFVYGYTFGELPKSRTEANTGPNFYAILIPGLPDTKTGTGGDGVGYGPSVTGRNYAFSVTGPADAEGATLPVTVRLTGSRTHGSTNPPAPLAEYDYENPFIGSSEHGFACTNVAPATMQIGLQVAVSGLVAGTHYNLYEYDFDRVSGTGSAAALDVPTAGFNAHANKATSATRFVATAPSFTKTVTRSSGQVVVFRAVRADAP